MPKPKIGKKSKRISCSKRYKIEKKVRQHNKKLKKDKESKDRSKRLKKHKDPGVPNNCPFKEEILKEAERRRNLLDEEKKRRVEKRKKDRAKILDTKRNIGSLAGLFNQATKKNLAFDKKQQLAGEKKENSFGSNKPLETSWKTYYKEVKKVIEAADVLIEVLDARDPLGSRCLQVEEAILNTTTRKKLILLLNKIDLVPKENVEKWLKYLRNEFPTIAFKASTQTQAQNLSRNRVPILTADSNLSKSASCLGAESLMTLLGNYTRSLDIKTSITVGILGFPNTGKSSIINSLKRSKACNVGSTPGVTKTMQVIQLDKHIKLLDSPGVVTSNSESQESAILKNCVKLENIEDATLAVSTILSRCTKEQMMMKYNIRQYADVDEFLQLLAKRFGRLKKGGLPDVHKTAKIVLQDWNTGKITYYTEPPEKYEKSVDISSEILTELSQIFDVSAIASNEATIFSTLKKSKQATDVIVKSDGPAVVDMTCDVDSEADLEPRESDMEVENGAIKVTMELGKTKLNIEGEELPDEDFINLQLNKNRKKDFKKLKRQRKRADALATSLSSALDKGLDSLNSKDNDDYNFDQFFK